MSQKPFTNRLATETSPYLRQHAHNPVDWYPWGPEALEKARQLDRPIFLSVGYSACHWCHVMEHESFEDDEVARLLNDHFISIKVDREERPDLDQIYMTAVQLLTGQGGWPMSVFLTPDLRPFFGGTYFPPENRYGRPGFKTVLGRLAEVWASAREQVYEQAGRLTQDIRQLGQLDPAEGKLYPQLLEHALGEWGRRFDPLDGGFGQPPKFLHTMDLKLLLRCWRRFEVPDALHMVKHTLTRMAMGGIYDHLGGGFARYSTDARWLVPHFEKMLYDNAQLVSVYLETWQATGDPFYREVAEETIGWVYRDMTSPEGLFYSTLDADSEGQEGKFYVWTTGEIESILGQQTGELFCSVYGCESSGNWEGHNILHRSRTWEQLSRLYRTPEPELQQLMKQARQRLLEVRNRRVWPGRDEKILTSWNALMIGALAEAATALDEPAHAGAASRAAGALLERMRRPDGGLYRTCGAGSKAKLNAYLEDYSFLIDALVSLYQATFEPRWIEEALSLAEVLRQRFWDAEGKAFFYTGSDHEPLISRNKDPYDNALPSGNSMAATGLLRLARLTGRDDLREMAEQTLAAYADLMARVPAGVGQMLCAYDFHLGPVQELAILGDPQAEPTQRVLRAVRRGFQPHRVVALKRESDPVGSVKLLEGKTANGIVTTYICENFACQAPLVGPEAVEQALAPG